MTSIIKVDQIQTAAGGTPTAADLGLNVSGSVVKMSNFNTSNNTQRSGSNDDTGWTNISGLSTLSHTMVSSSNKLLIIYLINWSGGGSTNSTARFRILDGSTNTAPSGSNGWVGQNHNAADGNPRSRASQMSGSYIYSPNAASVSLTAQINAPISGGAVRVNGDYNNTHSTNIVSTVTILEIAG
jgi:hypothetical protein